MWSKQAHSEDMNNLRQCPYDKCHQIRGERYLNHVVKCRQMYVKRLNDVRLPAESVICRYSCGMRCFPPEILLHEETCFLKPAFSGLENYFDRATMQEAQKLIKEERMKSLGWKKANNVVVAKKEEDPQKQQQKEEEKGKANNGLREMEWEAGDAEENWDNQDTGHVFSLFEPMMPFY